MCLNFQLDWKQMFVWMWDFEFEGGPDVVSENNIYTAILDDDFNYLDLSSLPQEISILQRSHNYFMCLW